MIADGLVGWSAPYNNHQGKWLWVCHKNHCIFKIVTDIEQNICIHKYINIYIYIYIYIYVYIYAYIYIPPKYAVITFINL